MPVFIDTNFFIAMVNEDDQYHPIAKRISWKVRGPFLTTEAVLTELANFFSHRRYRHQAVNTIKDIGKSKTVEVFPITHSLFQKGVTLYCARQDKDWSLTDCLSFAVMENKGVKEALTSDHHFLEAGYRALMLEQR